MPIYDRDELLARIDLEELFLELVGQPAGRGRSATWPCPRPDHTQSGATPPVSIDTAKGLWHCFSCDAGGSAIDVVMLTRGVGVAEAMAELARRVGLEPTEPLNGRRSTPRAATGDQRAQSRRGAPGGAERARASDSVPRGNPAELESYVAGCEAHLWAPAGADVLGWLRARGYSDDVLRDNRVGADPGAGELARADGLPRPPGPAAVFPVVDAGAAVYCQTRPIAPAKAGGKYLNPQKAVWGENPRVAVLAKDRCDDVVVMVCEGMTDALAAASHGYRAIAVLGAGYPDAEVAARIIAETPSELIALAFDGDERGDAGAERLASHLANHGAGRRVWRLVIPETIAADPKDRDLSTWAQVAGERFPDELYSGLERMRPAGWLPVLSAADELPAFLDRLAQPAGALAIPTGIAALDRLFADGGWRPGLVLLGGLPGIGKSAFALQTSLDAAGAGHPVVYVSVEQSQDELLGRLFCRELEAPISSYWNRHPDYLAGARRVAPGLSLEWLYLRSDPHIAGEDHVGTVGRVRRWAEEVVEVTGQRPLVIVDYLQRMRPPEPDRRLDERLRISMAGLGLRQLARDLEVPVLVISSIGRQSYEGAPKLDWFKGSGDLEYDADACIILRPDPTSEGVGSVLMAVELHLVKSRYGRLTGDSPIALQFDRRFGSFREPRRAPAPSSGFDDQPPPGLRPSLLEETSA
jgi:hypothetical protein